MRQVCLQEFCHLGIGYLICLGHLLVVSLSTPQLIIDLVEGQVVHLDLIDLTAHEPQHIILRGEFHLQVVVLLEQLIYQFYVLLPWGS